MSTLLTQIEKVRSKNAGPFWVTIDIFCAGETGYQAVCLGLDNAAICRVLQCDPQTLKRFDMQELAAIKLSIPRLEIQGTIEDRDMHGAAVAVLIEELLAGLPA